MYKTILSKQNISFFMFIFINFIFGIKYLSRATPYYLLFSSLIVCFYILIWKSRNYILKFSNYLNTLNFLILFLFISGFYFVFKKIPVESINVDRWSVITSFWNNFFSHKYVYFAKSCDGNYPGPMPFYFILALPFYFIGELGYFSILGIILFFLMLKHTKIDTKLQSTSLLLVCSSLFYLHEIVCRSNIFLNSTLVLFVLVIYFNQKKLSFKKLLFLGIMIGLSISTRNVLVIPFIIAFVFELKTKHISMKQLLLFGLISFSTFIVTFLPFVWNYFEDFKEMNPFIIQSSDLMPLNYTLVCIGLAFVFGYFSKSITDIYFFSGINLFITILVYFLYHIHNIGFQKTFFESEADITYFIFCIPFLVFYFLLIENSKTTT